MSYQIQYPISNRLEKKYDKKSKGLNKLVLTAVCAILLTVSAHFIGSDSLMECLVPGDNGVTVSAFNEMQSNLENGMGIKDAITEFCRVILKSANQQ